MQTSDSSCGAEGRLRDTESSDGHKRRPIEAYGYASRFALKTLVGWLPPTVSFDARKTVVVVRLDGTASLFAFDFGALVFVDASRARVDEILRIVGDHLENEPHPPLREDFLLEVDPSKTTPAVSFESVTLSQLTPLDVECLATVLAQSVAIDYYDEDLQAILARVEGIARDIAKTGKLGAPRLNLVRFVATSISFQIEMIGSMSLLDKPDFTWDDERCERLYDALRHHFEIRERHAALEAKLATIRESLSQFLDLNAARSSHNLELIVVGLIALEILLGLWDHFGR